MKKIILQLIMLFVSAQCFAAEVVFDFSNPHSLKTTTGESISVPAGGSVVISNKSFVDKGIVLTGGGALLYRLSDVLRLAIG